MHGQDVLCEISKDTFVIPHKKCCNSSLLMTEFVRAHRFMSSLAFVYVPWSGWLFICSYEYFVVSAYTVHYFLHNKGYYSRQYLHLDCDHQTAAGMGQIHVLLMLFLKFIDNNITSLIARFMGPTWCPSGAGRTQVGPMLAPWTLLSGIPSLGFDESLNWLRNWHPDTLL